MQIAGPIIGIGGGLLALWAGLSYLSGGNFVENAHYSVIASRGGAYEVRRYAPAVAASVRVPVGDVRAAGSAGFRPLARYIFGGNHARVAGDGANDRLVAPAQRVAMTAPVVSVPAQRVAMTAPVVSVPGTPSAAGASSSGDGWTTVSFLMPSAYGGVSDLPVPDDPAVSLSLVPARTEAVTQWYGNYPTHQDFLRIAATLLEAVRADGRAPRPPGPGDAGGVVVGGALVVAKCYGYSPPWTPWFMKKNEVAIELEEGGGGGGGAGGSS
jgi:hypothetical protein